MIARLVMKMDVVAVTRMTDSVSTFTFRHARRQCLPQAEPGAHIDLHLPDGRSRQYSLCGDPSDPSVYSIAVKRCADGRGGSRWIHENLEVGAVAHVSAPRNNFPLVAGALRHVFIAGGIGITPLVAMVKAAKRRQQDFV